MFHDDSMRSFFRRLTFTPDGSFLLAPGVCVSCCSTHKPLCLFEKVGLCYDPVCVCSQLVVWRRARTSQTPPMSSPGRALRGGVIIVFFVTCIVTFCYVADQFDINSVCVFASDP